MPTYEDGLRAAARKLIETAEDYEEALPRLRKQAESIINNRGLGLPSIRKQIAYHESSSTLLRGMAQNILDLRL